MYSLWSYKSENKHHCTSQTRLDVKISIKWTVALIQKIRRNNCSFSLSNGQLCIIIGSGVSAAKFCLTMAHLWQRFWGFSIQCWRNNNLYLFALNGRLGSIPMLDTGPNITWKSAASHWWIHSEWWNGVTMRMGSNITWKSAVSHWWVQSQW